MSRLEEDERLADLAAELANEPFEQADALRALAAALDRGEPLPLAIARPLIARMAKRELQRRIAARVMDSHHAILAALAKNGG